MRTTSSRRRRRRGLFPLADLAAKAAIYGLQGETAESVDAAIHRAQELAQPDDMIFIGGSTYVVAEAPLTE